MRFRPANISLINRRHYLPRLPLTMSSIKTDDHRTLTGHYISGPNRRQTTQNALSESIGRFLTSGNTEDLSVNSNRHEGTRCVTGD
jgi:hypothetical protein